MLNNFYLKHFLIQGVFFAVFSPKVNLLSHFSKVNYCAALACCDVTLLCKEYYVFYITRVCAYLNSFFSTSMKLFCCGFHHYSSFYSNNNYNIFKKIYSTLFRRQISNVQLTRCTVWPLMSMCHIGTTWLGAILAPTGL